MGISYFYLYPLRDLRWKKPLWGFHMPIIQWTFLKIFVNIKELWVNCEWTMNQLWVNYKWMQNKLLVNDEWTVIERQVMLVNNAYQC
jgi:hypothetical protein